MTSLGRLIFFDQPGTGAVRSRRAGRAADLGAVGRQHHRGARRSQEPRRGTTGDSRALPTAALFAATHPSRTTALVVVEGHADTSSIPDLEGFFGALAAMWGTREFIRMMNPDMPWNEEIRTTWARMERLAASPGTVALMVRLTSEMDVRAVLPTVRRANPCPPPRR